MAMLSSVLRSPQAIAVNIEIMRAVVRLRVLLASHQDLAKRLDELEAKTDARFKQIFEAFRQVMTPLDPMKKHQIGFVRDE